MSGCGSLERLASIRRTSRPSGPTKACPVRSSAAPGASASASSPPASPVGATTCVAVAASPAPSAWARAAANSARLSCAPWAAYASAPLTMRMGDPFWTRLRAWVSPPGKGTGSELAARRSGAAASAAREGRRWTCGATSSASSAPHSTSNARARLGSMRQHRAAPPSLQPRPRKGAARPADRYVGPDRGRAGTAESIGVQRRALVRLHP